MSRRPDEPTIDMRLLHGAVVTAMLGAHNAAKAAASAAEAAAAAAAASEAAVQAATAALQTAKDAQEQLEKIMYDSR